MGNYRFRLSDMIPNAWFYKLKDMSKPRNQHKVTNPTKKKHIPSSLSSSSASSSLSPLSVAPPNHPSKITDQSQLSDQRKSYYFSRDLTFHPNSPTKTRILDKQLPIEPPRKSSRRRRSTKRSRPPNRQPPRLVSSSSVSASCSCRATLESVWNKPPDSTPEEYPNSPLDDQTSTSEGDSVLPEYGSGSDRGLTPDSFDANFSTSCKCRTENTVVDTSTDAKKALNGEFDRVPELDHLPPIITKKHAEPTKIQRTSAEFSERNAYGSLSVKVVKEDFLSSGTWSIKDQSKTSSTSPLRRLSGNSSSAGVKLRTNSPRIGNRRIQGRKSASSNSSSVSRRSVSESFAVVKSSKDPQRDFRESMMEMIVENNIRASKDLEELLACYLSLNSDEYHDLIINVFKQIWFDFLHVRLK